MKVSVVMTSYNGEKYIYEQMLSIYEQTMMPNEVIISDDCSQDKTVEIIENFIKDHNLKNWKLIINSRNKGWMQNFIEVLAKAQGNYIFFSDQDDIWYKNKIETMVTVMENHPKIHCLVGNVTYIDGYGTIIQGQPPFLAKDNFPKLINRKFSANFNAVIMLGCSMCITRKLADIIIQIDVKNVAFDEQCCRLGMLMDGTYILGKPVIYHRQHEHNTSGFSANINYGSSNLKKRIEITKNNIIWLEKLLRTSAVCQFLNNEKKFVIKNTILFQNERLRFFSSKNVFRFINLFKYRKYYLGISMYLGDFAYTFHLNRLFGKILQYIKAVANKGYNNDIG